MFRLVRRSRGLLQNALAKKTAGLLSRRNLSWSMGHAPIQMMIKSVRAARLSLSLSLSPCSSSSDHPAAGRRRRSRLLSRRLPTADNFRFPNRTQSKSPLDLATGGLLPDHRLLPRNHCLERQQQCRCQHQERPSRSTRFPQQTLTRSTRSRRPRRRRRRMWSSSSTRGTTTIPL